MFAAPAAANPRALGRGSPAASKGRRKLPSRPSGAVSGTGGRDSRAGRTRRAPRRGQGVAGAASGPCWRQSHARLPAHGRGSRGQQTDAARGRHQPTSAEPGAGRPPWPGHGRVFQEEQVGGRPTGPGGRGHEQGDGQCGQEGAHALRRGTRGGARGLPPPSRSGRWRRSEVRSRVERPHTCHSNRRLCSISPTKPHRGQAPAVPGAPLGPAARSPARHPQPLHGGPRGSATPSASSPPVPPGTAGVPEAL